MRGLESLLRQAIKAYKKNPRSGTTLRYMSHFQRLGFRQGRAELLMQENGKGDLTDEFLRAGVNEIQGGYTYADVPVYMESPVGRALFKYLVLPGFRPLPVLLQVALHAQQRITPTPLLQLRVVIFAIHQQHAIDVLGARAVESRVKPVERRQQLRLVEGSKDRRRSYCHAASSP